MQETLNKVLDHIGYEERSEDDYPIKCLRQEVAKWACIIENRKCLEMAKYQLEQHLIHHKKLLPWWKEWTYCKGIMGEKNLTGIWKKALEKLMSDSDKRIFEFLTCIEHPNSIKEYLNINKVEAFVSLKNISFQFQAIDHMNRFFFIIIKHAKNDELFAYILNNLERLIPREVNTVASLIVIINHVYSLEQLEKIKEFVNNYFKKVFDKIIENIITKNIFFQKKFDKVSEIVNNLRNERISFIHHKTEKRMSEVLHLLEQLKKIDKFV